MQAELPPRRREPAKLRAQEVGQERAADEVATRKHGYLKRGAGGREGDDEGSQVFLLGRPDAEVDLIERGEDDEDAGQHEQGDGEAQRGEGRDDVAEEGTRGNHAGDSQ